MALALSFQALMVHFSSSQSVGKKLFYSTAAMIKYRYNSHHSNIDIVTIRHGLDATHDYRRAVLLRYHNLIVILLLALSDLIDAKDSIV